MNEVWMRVLRCGRPQAERRVVVDICDPVSVRDEYARGRSKEDGRDSEVCRHLWKV